MTTWSKKVGGPGRFMTLLVVGGMVFGGTITSAGHTISSKVKKKLDEMKDHKEKMAASAIVYEVSTEATSNEGLCFQKGEFFKVLEEDGDAGLIEKIGDKNNPYFVSRKFLSDISNYEIS